MNHFTTGFIITALLSLISVTTLSADVGKDLYNKNCTACHGNEVFTRPDRKAKDLTALKNRVRQCSFAVEANWFDDDIDAVAAYLNNTFYKF